MTLETRWSSWSRIAVKLTVLLIAVGATSLPRLPRERAWGAESATDALVVAGSGANLDITRRLAEEFRRIRPDIRIDVPPSIGSGGATKAVVEGAVGIGLISRELKENESRLGLTALPYARTIVVVGVHPAVVDDGLTSDELVAIYLGTKNRWRDGRDIVVLTREPGDSSIEVLGREIPGFKGAYAESQRVKRWHTLFTDQDMNRAIAGSPYAVGFSQLGDIAIEKLPIKVLKLNGVVPSLGNAQSGKYPLVKTLCFVFVKDRLRPEAKAFLDFARSKQAHAFLRAQGFLPGE
jgi:phosphate transport system substrate-binding protein